MKETVTLTRPCPGELWSVAGGYGHAVCLEGSLWNVLVRRHDEYTLIQVEDLTPEQPSPVQPASLHWADQFDALAAASSLPITWAGEVAAYRADGLARSGVGAL